MPRTTRAFRNCECGCGGQTQSRFVPGHDQRMYGNLVRVIRTYGENSEQGQMALDALANLGWMNKYNRVGTSRDTSRRFGVELEIVHGSRWEMVRALQAAGIEVQDMGYTHRVRTCWKIVTDSSVAGGYEIVSPVLQGERGFAQLEKVCRVLAEQGAKINKTCGLHVHHEVRDLSAGQIIGAAIGYTRAQGSIDSVVAPSRRTSANNRYCAGCDMGTLQMYASRDNSNWGGTNRYQVVNLTSYPKYGTLELRQHQGSIEYTKIRNWVLFGQQLIEAAKSGREIGHRNDFLQADQQAFYNRREARFAASHTMAA